MIKQNRIDATTLFIIKVYWYPIDYNCGHTPNVPKIVTWYGHLRDTLAGKILTSFHKYLSLPKNLRRFYRQKCRAAAEVMGVWERSYTFEFKFKFESHQFSCCATLCILY
jgi:hypothetical protein